MSPPDQQDPHEAARIAALRRYEILDTPPDGNFNGITSLAAKLLKVPIALTTLVDTDRIWFASKHGLDIDQIGRDPGLCASAILNGEPYVVNDAAFDPRTLANPLVAGEFGLRFYAAVPLRTHDHFNLGTLCVIDKEPREITESELSILQILGELVMDQMELRLASRRVDEANRKLAEMNDEKQHFLTMASQELRNPLTAVMLFSKMLEEQKVGPLNPQQEEMVSEIFQSSEVMLKHVKNYLDRSGHE
jgi:GAF domain-containing protein